MSRLEHQIKMADTGLLTIEHLISLGAEFLGTVNQSDTYFDDASTRFRIRDENGILTYSAENFRHDEAIEHNGNRNHLSCKQLTERLLSAQEASQILRQTKGHLITRVFKERQLLRFHDCIVIFDRVEYLGHFIKIRSEDREQLIMIMNMLEIPKSSTLTSSYLQMMRDRKLPRHLVILQRFHEKTGELTFGITSGVMTTIGLLAGMNSATGAKLPIVASIAVIACADSLSDSFGMFMSKLGERGTSKIKAFRFALGTLAGKFFFPLTFLLPIMLFDSLSLSVWVDIAWGLLVLSILTIEQAIVKEESIKRNLLQNLELATLSMGLSSLIGRLIASWLA